MLLVAAVAHSWIGGVRTLIAASLGNDNMTWVRLVAGGYRAWNAGQLIKNMFLASVQSSRNVASRNVRSHAHGPRFLVVVVVQSRLRGGHKWTRRRGTSLAACLRFFFDFRSCSYVPWCQVVRASCPCSMNSRTLVLRKRPPEVIVRGRERRVSHQP